MTPIREAVEGFLAKGRAPFHMPGHKGRGGESLGIKYDITEVEGVDSLYHAQEAILECEQRYAKHYGTSGSFLSAGGSTLCIQAMLALAAQRGRRIIAGRMIHSAAVAAMALLGLEPIWIYTPTAASPKEGIEGLSLQVTAQQVEEALSRNPDAAAVYLTSPDYFGQLADVQSISEVCRKAGVPLLIDNAHGAHLQFFGCHPMQLGADLCCDSLHKSLPVLTGGSVLHTSSGIFAAQAKEKMGLFGSTSPSYLILCSIDAALEELEGDFGQRAKETAQRMKDLGQLARAQGLETIAPGGEPMRLTVGFGKTGWSDGEFGELVRLSGIEPEYLGGGVCVFLASPYTTGEDYARLEGLLQGFSPKAGKESIAGTTVPQLILPRMCGLRAAALAPHRTLPSESAQGHTCGGVVSSCPPGIPLLVPGELVTPAAAAALVQAGISEISVLEQQQK